MYFDPGYNNNINIYFVLFFRFMGDKNLENDDRVKMELKQLHAELAATLHVENIEVEDACEVKAVATNSEGEATCTATMTVQSKI